jgi:uncharacterized membrane protein YraQ (UPF0718 family)
LPLFSGIRTRGAGLGPAIAFLYSGPALDIPPLVYTFTLLGGDLGVATMIGISVLAVVIGLLMNFIYPEIKTGAENDIAAALPENTRVKKLWIEIIFFGLLLTIMILTTGRSYFISLVLFGILVVLLLFTFTRDDMTEWGKATWQFIRSIIPWLVVGSLGAALIGVLLPETIVSDYVGGSSLFSCFISAVIGSLLYFCSLAQIPFVRVLMDLGMGKGPALALLLTGPAVSLPSMLVLTRVMGIKKTLTYIGLVISLATFSAYIFGLIVG